MNRIAAVLVLAALPAVARADDQDEAIAHVVNLGGRITRDTTKPERPVVEISLLAVEGKRIDFKKLAAFTELRSLDLGATRVTDSMASQAKQFKSLVSLNLSGAMITGFTFDLLADSKIETLNLSTAVIGDEDLKNLASMKSLKSVDLSFIKLTDAALPHLAGLPDLESVVLSGLPVTDQGLKALTGIKKLKSLSLSSTKITEAGLKPLAGVAGLTELFLFGVPIGDEGLKSLAPLKLRKLAVDGPQLIDDDLQSLSAWPALEELTIEGASLTNACMKHIAPLRKLNQLHLNNIKRLGDGAMKEIASLPELKVLMVFGTKITETGLAELAAAKNLEFLTLPDTPTDAIVEALNKVGKLHTLDCCSKRNGGRFINRPKSLAEVDSIDLYGAGKLTAEGLKQFADCRKLKTASFVKAGFTDAAMKELASFPDLEDIGLFEMPLTDDGLKSLASMKNLKRLYHSGCKFTDAGLNELKKAIPDLKVN